MRSVLYTTLNSIPGVLLIAPAVLMMQVLSTTTPTGSTTAQRGLVLCAILGLTSWTGLARLARRVAQALPLSTSRRRTFGVRLARSHAPYPPNVAHIVVIAGDGFLGVGARRGSAVTSAWASIPPPPASAL
jgi:peptide/nickel transport system permease protein